MPKSISTRTSDSTVFDYVIVGAGSAGCVLAERLSRDPAVTVLVLEAGGSDDSVLIRSPMLMGQAIQSSRFNWHYHTTPQSELNDRRLYWPRGRVLGGSSAINAMHYIRGAAENYDAWRDMCGADGWGWDQVLPAFMQVEGQTRGSNAHHATCGPLTVQDIAPLNPLTQAFFAAGQAAGYRLNLDFNGPEQAGFGPYQVTQRGNRRWSAADAFLKPALDRPNLTVRTGVRASRVLMDGLRASGVEGLSAGDRLTFEARREVILSGGAINSPQLLQLSGIGDPAWLRAAGISPVVDLPGVGRNLQDHLDITAQIETRSSLSEGLSVATLPRWTRAAFDAIADRPGLFSTNPIQGGAFIHSSRAGALPDLQLVFTPALAAPHGARLPFGHGVTLHACALYPVSRGHVRIVSSDPLAHPAIDPAYLSAEADLDVMVDGLAAIRSILQSQAFDFDRRRETLPGPGCATRAELADDVRTRAETLYHPVGTCSMGRGGLSVVDPALRVHQVENLRVVDASVMPRLIGGNTNAPTMMIATRAADMILAEAN